MAFNYQAVAEKVAANQSSDYAKFSFVDIIPILIPVIEAIIKECFGGDENVTYQDVKSLGFFKRVQLRWFLRRHVEAKYRDTVFGALTNFSRTVTVSEFEGLKKK